MGNDSTVVLSDEPLFHSHLTDDEIAEVTGLKAKSLKTYRITKGLPKGTRLRAACQTYYGATIFRTRNFTHVDALRAWLVVHRPGALTELDNLMAGKLAASPEAGE